MLAFLTLRNRLLLLLNIVVVSCILRIRNLRVFLFFFPQLLRRDEALNGILMRPRRPRAVVLCPTRELCEQVCIVCYAV